MNDLEKHANLFDGITPWRGEAPKGFQVNFLGTLVDNNLRAMAGENNLSEGGNYQETRLPTVKDGEAWFEAYNAVMSAREATGHYTMISLGACYGGQAVDSFKALQLLNPMPCKLVAVEPVADNVTYTKQHFRDNGIEPDDHWILNATLSDTNKTVLFPDGSPCSGAQNCFSTNDEEARQRYVQFIIENKVEQMAIQNLILSNSTGLQVNLVAGTELKAELKFLSAVTLGDVLGPFDFVDYVECDIQQSEVIVFPPAIEALTKKVRRVLIGTHGHEAHKEMFDLFSSAGWEIVFSYEPNTDYETSLGSFHMNDGALTAVNPNL